MKVRERDTKFGALLRNTLVDRKLMQADLADRLEVSSTYVSSIITGAKGVSARRVTSIAKALHMSSEEEILLHRAAAEDLGFSLGLSHEG